MGAAGFEPRSESVKITCGRADLRSVPAVVFTLTSLIRRPGGSAHPRQFGPVPGMRLSAVPGILTRWRSQRADTDEAPSERTNRHNPEILRTLRIGTLSPDTTQIMSIH